MGHWWMAMIFVTSLGAYTAIVWFLLAFPRHAHRRMLMMLDSGWPGKRGYGWRDAGVLLRRKTKRENGPSEPPGKHRVGRPEPQPPPVTLVQIMAPKDEPSELRAEIDSGPWPPLDPLPEDAGHHTLPGRGHVAVVDEPSTATMTRPVILEEDQPFRPGGVRPYE